MRGELLWSHAPQAVPYAGYLFFHDEGNRALRVKDWKIASATIDDDTWGLYNLAVDRAESTDLAGRYPDRVRKMSAQWQEMEEDFRRQAGTNTAARPQK